MRSLEGQVAVVTGGARGIGYGIARVLRAEGAHVVLADHDGAAAEAAAKRLDEDGPHTAGPTTAGPDGAGPTTAGPDGAGPVATCIATTTDVTSGADLEAMAAAAVERWGRIDILAANAGVYPHIPLVDLDQSAWDRLMAVNVRGAVFAVQACLPAMTARHYGRIVLTSSITGSLVGQPGYAHYGASKAAMLGFMRSAALEVAGAGITVNAVLPGNIRTPGFDDLGTDHEAAMLAAIPLGVFGEPEDVGWAVRFLASPEAGYITGQTLVIDGGQVLPESS